MPAPLRYFYPRSPCGERRWSVDVPGWILGISIHALLAESDLLYAMGYNRYCDFYPRSPCGERLYTSAKMSGDIEISIHALLAESDGDCCRVFFDNSIISIHALLAESDHHGTNTGTNSTIFLSTLSLRRATFLSEKSTALPIFLSTLSLRRATPHGTGRPRQHCISIHALLAESDSFGCYFAFHLRISIHALLAESDSLVVSLSYIYIIFLSTLSLRRATG